MRRSLNIAMPTPGFLPTLGGMEVGLHNIASRLAQRGHKVSLIIPASQYKKLKAAGFHAPYGLHLLPPRTISFAARYPDAATKILAQYFRFFGRRHSIDAWHATMAWPLGVSLARLGNVPALVRSAGADIQIDEALGYGFRLNPKIDRLVREWLPKIGTLVAITDTVAGEYRALGIPADKIVNIPNGVDVARFEKAAPLPDFRAGHGLKPDTFLFLGVGRNHPKKNFAALVPAVKHLAGQAPDMNFAVVLAGQDMRQLQSAIDEAGIQKYFLLLDKIAPARFADGFDLPADDLLALYKTADCFLFPSLIETFGIALVEAMAAGLPVLTADAPGCRDIAEGGRYAHLFDPESSTDIAAAMLRMMREPDWRRQLIQKSKERAVAFDWNAVVSQYEDLYYRMAGDA